MNKKMMAMVATAAMAFAANAAKEYVDGYTWEYSVANNEVTILGVDPKIGSVIIPRVINGSEVRIIGSYALQHGEFETIIVPDTVTELKTGAFYYSGAKSIRIPESVKTFGEIIFRSSPKTTVLWTLSDSQTVNINANGFKDAKIVLVAKGAIPKVGGNSWCHDALFFSTNEVYGPNITAESFISFMCRRQNANSWIKEIGYDKFAGYIDDTPEVEIVSAGVRENDPTVMDVVYKVYSDKTRVKVRALAFQDGQRSLAKVVPVKTLIEGTDANIGDSVTANAEHKLSWKVSTDWATDLAKVKFEVLAVEDDILSLELQTIPATANHAAMKISWNKMTDDKVFDALLWLYASGDTGLTLTNGQLRNGGTILASGTGIYNGQSAVTYIFGKMGYGVLSGNDLAYARRVTQLDLPTSGVQQFAVKTIAQ